MTSIEEVLLTPTPAQSKKLPPIVVDDFPRCCSNGTREKPLCDDCKAEAVELHGPVTKFMKETNNG